MKNSIKILITILFIYGLSIPLQAQDTLSIYFPNNQFQLSKRDEGNLDILASKTVMKQIEKSICIIGFADYKGHWESNQTLSEKRVKSVENYLLKKGMSPDYIKVAIGFGSIDCKHEPQPANGCPEHRKVEIIFFNTPLPVKPVKEKKPVVIAKPDIVKAKDSIIETKTILDTEVGETLILDNINFYGGQDIWLEESVPALEKLLETLLDNPTLEIEIQGHICCDRVDRENLSTKRALAIYKYLVGNGVEKKRLKYKGFGRTRPLVNNFDETKNRRVELLILHK